MAAKKKRPRRDRRTLAILSRKRSLYSTRRLVEAAKARDVRARVYDTLELTLVLETDSPQLFYRGAPVEDVGCVIPRIGASITAYGLAVVNQFDMMGVPVVNNSVPIARSRDKLRCLQLLSRFGIPIPRTVMAREKIDLDKAIARIGGLPAIIKLIQGTQGVGVMIAHSMAEIATILETMQGIGQQVLLQEFVAESKGRDVRALVVGDRVVGAMRRVAREGEFRSNIHRGGEGEPLPELPPGYAEVAVKAAQVIGLEVAGVDLLESDAGPKVMEVNSSPGFEGLEQATGADVAGAIVEHAMVFAEAVRSGFQKPRVI